MSMAVIAVVTAVAGIGTSIHQGEQQRKAGRQQMLAQERAQKKAERAEIGTKRLADQEKRRSNQKKSGIEQYMAQAASAGSGGVRSTMTNNGGVSLLGGRSPSLLT